MIDIRLRLSVLHDNNGVFSDYSDEAIDFSRDPFTITLLASDSLYIGHTKPFSATYCEVTTANTEASTMVMEYWDGSAWVEHTAGVDLTKGFTRSGFLAWTKPSDWDTTEVNSKDKYWLRLTPSDDQTATVISGINLVFADDYDLETEFPAARSMYPATEVSHIKTHVAVRNQLIQDLRNRGYLKQTASGDWLNLTPWDLHDIEEVRQASTFLALAKIFSNFSDDPQDHWTAKAKAYELKYKEQLELLQPSVDKNDDGVETGNEKFQSRIVRMTR